MAVTLSANINDINIKAREVLFDNLGPMGYARFMEQFDNGGKGDYTEDRKKEKIYSMSVEEIVSDVQKMNE